MEDRLQYIADSGIWDRIKNEVLQPKIDEMASVMNDIVINKIPLSPEDAYKTKAYAVQAILDIVRSIDMHKSRRTSPIGEFRIDTKVVKMSK